jgi:hypothetical protein
MTWKSVLARMIICPIAVAIGDYTFPGVRFAAPSQWIAVGLVMAVISTALDTLFLDRLGVLGASLLNAVLVAGIVRVAPNMMPQVSATRTGSILVGVLLGLVEAVMFQLLFGSARQRRRGQVRSGD